VSSVEEGQHIARLLVSCPDRHGIVAAVSGFLSEQDANILSSDQHSTDPEGGTFFMRMEFRLERLLERRSDLEREFAERVAEPLDMDWRFAYADRRKRTALLASRDDHCLLDLLWRWRRGELETDIMCVVSNHPNHAADVAGFGVPYHHVPVTPETKAEAEAQILEHLAGVDLVVLARYMQILSRSFLERLSVPVINIHHSFLPAFVGADPYRRARERGVKIIGATAHYVTEELDAGPIIEQDVARVSHRQGVEELERIGRDIERVVLGRAVAWHLQDRVLVHENRTVVF
jgi:formyltetrahydrofolate deformylase